MTTPSEPTPSEPASPYGGGSDQAHGPAPTSDYLAATYPAGGFHDDPEPGELGYGYGPGGQPGHPPAGYPQGYAPAGYPQGYAPAGYPQQAYPQPGYQQQGYPQQGYPQPGYPQQVYPQGYGTDGYPAQGYGAVAYPAQGYGSTGYGSTGYGPVGYPQYGQGGPWATPPPPNDSLAVAALITGIVSVACFFFIAGPVALGLGIAGLRRTAAAGTRGRGMAIAGIVLGSLGTLLLLFFVIGTMADTQ